MIFDSCIIRVSNLFWHPNVLYGRRRDMIKEYIFGEPFETYAVEKAVVEGEEITKAITSEKSYFSKEEALVALKPYGGITWDDSSYVMTYEVTLGKDDIVYGLGENVRGINKRGWIYESKCSDESNHDEYRSSLYGAHNFIMVTGKEPYGLFIDYPGRVIWDVAYSDIDVLKIIVCSENFKMYLITSKEADKKGQYRDIIKQFRRMIGKSYIAPKWAFGFQQSRWSYGNEEDVESVVENYRKNNIPIDAVYLDIDYMERFKDFTIDNERFPKFEKFVARMKERHIHLVPIIDAGVKIEEGYPVYEEGVGENYFCKEEDGSDFVGGVWPGKVHFPDFLNAGARRWFGNKYKVLIDAGIDGFWNDMNEPALFYSDKHLKEVFEEIESYKKTEIDIHSFFRLGDLVRGLGNNLDDYKRFYHRATQPQGEVVVRHDHVHNIYGYNMTRAASDAFKELVPDKNILMFSRASYIGMHRYGGIWTGDNHSWWSHILLLLKMLPSLNMCGFMYIGADMGGFNGNATEDLIKRWTAMSMFVPLMRNHSAAGTRNQELYRFNDTKGFVKLINIRYALIPYIYSEYMKAIKNDDMMYIPLSMEYPDDKCAVNAEDQMFVGESIMIAPVYTQNQTGRYVYLPENMTQVKMRSLDDYELTECRAGHHYVDVSLDEVVFFIREGHAVPLGKGGQYVDDIDVSEVTLLRAKGSNAEYKLVWEE